MCTRQQQLIYHLSIVPGYSRITALLDPTVTSKAKALEAVVRSNRGLVILMSVERGHWSLKHIHNIRILVQSLYSFVLAALGGKSVVKTARSCRPADA